MSEVCDKKICVIQNFVNEQNEASALPVIDWTLPKIKLVIEEQQRQQKYGATKRQDGIPRAVKRGQIYMAELGTNIGSEQSGIRPILVLQDESISPHSPTVVIVPMTDYYKKDGSPKKMDQTELAIENSGLKKKSIIKPKQIRCISKNRLREYIGDVNSELMSLVEERLKISLMLK